MKDLKIKKAAMTILFTNLYLLLFPHVVFASSNIAEKGVKWLLGQAVWIVIGAVVLICIGLAAKRAYAAMIGVAIGGIVVIFFCISPETFKTIAEQIGQSIFN